MYGVASVSENDETRSSGVQGIKNISVQSSTTLQHLPYCVDLESEIPREIQGKLSFACQKLKEIVKAKNASAGSGSLTSALPEVSKLPLLSTNMPRSRVRL